ncbi:hypothetical protein [Streptomyces sp. NPDC052107]|uniref:hypothetical protein n=1 Tax=Streptomyces sp. NPDC052107 TaxID=3155632 RepID=UPI00342FB6D1
MPRRDLRAGAAATAATQAPANGSTASVTPVGTALDTTQETSPAKLRDQPFTLTHWGATLPERDVTPEEASGPLRPDELEQLAECHRAIDNAGGADGGQHGVRVVGVGQLHDAGVRGAHEPRRRDGCQLGQQRGDGERVAHGWPWHSSH